MLALDAPNGLRGGGHGSRIEIRQGEGIRRPHTYRIRIRETAAPLTAKPIPKYKTCEGRLGIGPLSRMVGVWPGAGWRDAYSS